MNERAFVGSCVHKTTLLNEPLKSPVFKKLTTLSAVMLTSERQSAANEKNTLTVYFSFIQIYLFFHSGYRTQLCF